MRQKITDAAGVVTGFNRNSYVGYLFVNGGTLRFWSTQFRSIPTRFPKIGDIVKVFFVDGDILSVYTKYADGERPLIGT